MQAPYAPGFVPGLCETRIQKSEIRIHRSSLVRSVEGGDGPDAEGLFENTILPRRSRFVPQQSSIAISLLRTLIIRCVVFIWHRSATCAAVT